MSDKNLKNVLTVIYILLICGLCALGLYMTGLIPGRGSCDPAIVCPALPAGSSADSETAEDDGAGTQQAALSDTSCTKPVYGSVEDVPGSLFHDGYTLKKVVVLSRHNIRSPLSSPDSLLGTITPHEWFKWSSGTSELSLRGGTLEMNMGNFFRKWLEEEKLFPENYRPEEGKVRIYANSKQRTIATAQSFLAGLLPTANLDVEYHAEFDKMDPVFTPQLTFISEDYITDARSQVEELFSDTIASLNDNYEFLSDVIDMEASEAWKNNSVAAFSTDDTEYVLELNAEPGLKGSLKTATNVSDALVLQYYEEPDPVAAAFGNSLTQEQWAEISEIVGVYEEVLFTAPLISANVANPLLKVLRGEINEENRIFTFLCGHDSNVASVLSALEVESYSLPNTIEKITPIGVKVVFSELENPKGETFWAVDLVYQTTEQLRDITLLDLETHPAIVPVILHGLERNGDGLYPDRALKDRFDQVIARYDELAEKYAGN